MPQPAHQFVMKSPRPKLPNLGTIPTYTILWFWAFVCLFPLYWAVVTSLKGPLQIIDGPYYVPLIDYTPSLGAWTYILFDSSEAPLSRYFNSAVVAAASTAVTVPLGGLAVYGLTRFRLRVSWAAVTLVLVAIVFAGGAFFIEAIGFRLLLVTTAVLTLLVARLFNRYGRAGVSNTGILIAILATRILPPIVIVLPIFHGAAAVPGFLVGEDITFRPARRKSPSRASVSVCRLNDENVV